MNLVKCNNGHFYDAETYASCPHCSAVAGDSNVTMPFTAPSADEEPVTMPLTGAATPLAVPDPSQPSSSLEEALRNAKNSSVQEEDDDGKTISIYQHAGKGSSAGEPTVGWLVCIDGSDFGQSYVIRTGRNFIGRGSDMDIVIKGDQGISRERHAVILYEPKKRIFIAQAGDSRELFYVNEEVVLSSTQLKMYDILTLGNTKLMFIPFCGENFGWDDLEPQED